MYGQFPAAIVLGFAFAEHTLAAMFYASGCNDLERAQASVLFREAIGIGWLSPEEHAWLERAKKLRNPVTHFRQPVHEDTVEHRGVAANNLPYSILEEDSRHVMLAVVRLLSKGAV